MEIVVRHNYKTVSFSITSSAVEDEFSESVWIFVCENSTLRTQTNIRKIKTPTASIPPAHKKAVGYELVLSATKPGNTIKRINSLLRTFRIGRFNVPEGLISVCI